MKKEPQNAKIRELRAAGYKPVSDYPQLYINSAGKVYNITKGSYEAITGRNMIRPNNKNLSIPKLVLQCFAKQEYRYRQRIIYIDGDQTNNDVSNIKYARLFKNNQTNTINEGDLLTAIRCYFKVDRKYKVTNKVLTRMYLAEIISLRGYYSIQIREQNTAILKTYMQGLQNSYRETAQTHKISIRDCEYIVNEQINALANDILNDLAGRNLKVKDYQPRPLTKSQLIENYNSRAKVIGAKPIPTRKKSMKQKMRRFNFRAALIKFKMKSDQLNTD